MCWSGEASATLATIRLTSTAYVAWKGEKKHHKFLFQLIFSTIGEPKGRGKIEQFFITVNQLLLAKLPGYAPLGHKFPNPVLNLALLEKEFESCLFN